MVARALACLAALLLTTSPAFADEVSDLVAALDASNARQSRAAYRTLLKRRDDDALPSLRRGLPTFGDRGQLYGTLLLDSRHWSKTKRIWRDLLEAEAPYLRLRAAIALLRHGDEDALEPAVLALTSPDAKAVPRRWMISLIQPQDPPRLHAAMRTFLKPGGDADAIRRVLLFLQRTRDPAATPQLRRLLDDPRADVRARVAAVLYDLGDMPAALVLAELLEGELSSDARSFVSGILSSNRRVVDVILVALVRRLEAATRPADIRRELALIGRLRPIQARPVLRRLVDHEDTGVARLAFDILCSLDGPLRDDTLRPMLRGSDVKRRLWAAEALRRRDDLSGLGAMVYALQTGTVTERRQAALLLGTIPADHAVEPLMRALVDRHPTVRSAAQRSLTTLLRTLFPYRTLDLASTGYTAQGDASVRAAAVDRIRAWWRQARAADW